MRWNDRSLPKIYQFGWVDSENLNPKKDKMTTKNNLNISCY
jgi:hypothetical protein